MRARLWAAVGVITLLWPCVSSAHLIDEIAQSIVLDVHTTDAQQFTLTLDTGGADGFEAALKPGADPIYYTGDTHDAFATLPFEHLGDDLWAVTFAGSCLSGGPWTLAVHNLGGDFSISSATVTFSEEPPADPNFQCGG